MAEDIGLERKLWEKWEVYLKSQAEDNLVPDDRQLSKVLRLFTYLNRHTRFLAGTDEPLELIPQQGAVILKAKLLGLSLAGNQEVAEFCALVRDASAVGFDAFGEEFVFSVTIPGVFCARKA